MKFDLYPFKFDPILKARIWGGNKLKTVLEKPTNQDGIGESWEISDVKGDTSVISNGPLKGKSLKEILSSYGSELIGKKNYQQFGHKFPLLIKFIDAKEDLSIQLHPNDELAEARHDSFGKTEMWYVMEAEEDANLIVGFNQRMNEEIYLKHLEEKTLQAVLNYEKVKEGDTFFIEVGRIHAIGAGVLLAEIQQTSDVTYRIYDWDREDAQGNSRELHTELALEAIDYNMDDDFKVAYQTQANMSNAMVSCPYFTTNFLPLTKQITVNNCYDSFIIYMCVDGEVSLRAATFDVQLKKGETVLVPAAIHQFELITENAKLLEVYV